MNTHVQTSTTILVLIGTTSAFSDTVGEYAAIRALLDTSSHVYPLQVEWNAHLAALLGILALAILGGVLMARNRFAEQNALVADPHPPNEEYLTDQEKVQQLIRDNGGRMKQSKIVDSVDWSKAKVSRLLADLEKEGRITKLRLGRENLVCLPGHEPQASQTPEQPKGE